jgi:hypothetical protein
MSSPGFGSSDRVQARPVSPAPGAGGGGSKTAPDVGAPALHHPNPLLNAILRSINTCVAPPEGVFASKTDYLHHARFVLGKLCERPDAYADVYVSESYLAVLVHGAGPLHMYLYGVSDDGGVFVNGVEGVLGGWKSHRAGGKVEQAVVTSDANVRRLLDYDREAPGEEYTVREPGRYRVQGDLCVEVNRLDSTLFEDLFTQLVSHQTAVLSDIVMRALTDIGFNVEVSFAWRLLILFEEVPDVGGLVGLLAQQLSDLGVVGGVAAGAREARLKGAGDYANCDLLVEVEGSAVTVVPVCRRERSGLAWRMLQELRAGLKPRRFELAVGNHSVVLENAISGRIVYRPGVQPLAGGDRLVWAGGEGSYIVTPGTIVTVMHREHGVKVLKFDGDYTVRFYTLRRSTKHWAERNTITLELATRNNQPSPP